MTIHYATGTAADAHAWLDAIRTFATGTLGYTEDTWSSSGGISRLHLHNTAGEHLSCDLRSRTFGGTALALGLARATGYASGSAWDAQTGTSGLSYASHLGGSSLTYHLFGGTSTDGDWCHAVLETAAGVFASAHFGSLVKAGTWTGGAYCDGMRWLTGQSNVYSLHVPFVSVGANNDRGGIRADLDGATAPKWWPWGTSSGGADANSTTYAATLVNRGDAYGPVDAWLTALSPNALNGRTVLWPIAVYAPRPSSYWSHLGDIGGLRACSMEQLAAGEEITLGSETWMVFPARAKGAVAALNTTDTGWIGYAYRKS
jgi:hypothetical protein